MTPYCPKCGSIDVDKINKSYQCNEKDCHHLGSAESFKNHVGYSKSGNDHWRDPVALLPGNYEDN